MEYNKTHVWKIKTLNPHYNCDATTSNAQTHVHTRILILQLDKIAYTAAKPPARAVRLRCDAIDACVLFRVRSWSFFFTSCFVCASACKKNVFRIKIKTLKKVLDWSARTGLYICRRAYIARRATAKQPPASTTKIVFCASKHGFVGLNRAVGWSIFSPHKNYIFQNRTRPHFSRTHIFFCNYLCTAQPPPVREQLISFFFIWRTPL